jgi:hypothetical protein
MTVSDLYGLGNGNLAAGRMRVALFGTLERVLPTEEEACKKAYLAGFVFLSLAFFSFFYSFRFG